MWLDIVLGLVTFAITVFIAVRGIHRSNELHSLASYRMTRDIFGLRGHPPPDPTPPRPEPTSEEESAKAHFYEGKTVKAVYWYLHDCELPETLRWARLRVFDDGSADSTFSEEDTAFGFVNEDYASYILSEDEYVCFSTFDDEDDAHWGMNRHEITPPDWVDAPDKPFKFLGTY